MAESMTAEDFYLELPLYSRIQWERDQVFHIAKLLFYVGTIDCFCLDCGKDSTFRNDRNGLPLELKEDTYKKEVERYSAISAVTTSSPLKKPEPPLIQPDIYLSAFSCGRNHTHKLQFLYKVQSGSHTNDDGSPSVTQFLEKIGQYPSIAALNLPEIKKYRAVLPYEVYSDLAKGIGLAAHDVGIGSYVYLRRVFERLVEDAHIVAKHESGWDEDLYKQMRMSEKITALKSHLPQFLVSHAGLYSLLSKGLL
ncbi:hypothetical protein [Marinobacter zhanjiangensis]|uniref:Uncharacterized protein n=1 Tax=Marinobacter zhanjiangensis TaxID=578215 RepID=A0ABQ3AVX2_9GAMM|nr:hypothetical protein [Marinobacter zhanjiangensis]GGY66198.1 hypothetical protein GCM10007071_11240 [Marinobacter zhanjiangensis]